MVDEDGSVYTGTWQRDPSATSTTPAASGVAREQARDRDAMAGAILAAQSQSLPPVNFSVSGMNRSLSQQMVFTGQLQQVLLQSALTNQSNAVAQSRLYRFQSNNAQSQVAPEPNLQQRILGEARLEDGRRLQVDALSVGQ
jgi:hypothetical protein